MMLPFLAPLVYLLFLVFIGLPLLYLVLPRDRKLVAELWLPLSFALGWGIHAFIGKLFLLLFGVYPFWILYLVLLVGIAGHAVHHHLGTRWSDCLGGFRIHRIPPRGALLHGVLLMLLVSKFALLLGDALRTPFFTWDGRMIWNLKALILYHEETIFTGSFLDPNRVHFHRDYPLMLPMAYTSIYQIAGGVHDRLARVFLVLFFALFTLAIYGAIRARASGTISLVVALLATSVAFRQDYGFYDGVTLLTGVADHPLSFYIFLTFYTLYRAINGGGTRWLVLAGLLAGSSMMLKAEGIIVLAMLVGTVFLWLVFWRPGRRQLAGAGWMLLVAILVALPWVLLSRYLPNFYDESFGDKLHVDYIPKMIERIPLVIELIGEEVTDISKWGILLHGWILLLPLSLFFWKRGKRVLLDVVILVWMAGYFVVYLITPLMLSYHIPTSIGRLLTHFHALILFQLGTLFGLVIRWWRIGEGGELDSGVADYDNESSPHPS